MNSHKAASLLMIAILLLVILAASACGSETTKPATDTPPTGAQPADGATLLQARCTQCHGLARVEQAHKNLAQWESAIQRMRGKGATLSDEEAQTLAQYLAATYGK